MSYATAPNLGMPAPRLATQYPGQISGSFSGAGGPVTSQPEIVLLTPDFRQVDLAAALALLGVQTGGAVDLNQVNLVLGAGDTPAVGDTMPMGWYVAYETVTHAVELSWFDGETEIEAIGFEYFPLTVSP